MAATEARPSLLRFLTPELRPAVISRTDSLLLKVVRANLDTQYVSKADLLAEFRSALSTRGINISDAMLIEDFRHCVPLSDYDSYKSFMAAFDKNPCKETEVENLFAPGLPFAFTVSSATSGRQSKKFPRYNSSIPSRLSSEEGPAAIVLFCGYQDVKDVEREPGQIVKRIPVSTATSCVTRAIQGWTNINDDDSRMSVIVPGFVAPMAASMINSHKSFLMIHALFALACRDLDRILTVFSTVFYDLVRYIDEEWDMFISSIRNGTVPDLLGVHKVRSHLQACFQANPDRAAELGEIGSPFSRAGWAALAWPKLRRVIFGCSGSFASVLPKVKSIIGPSISIQGISYGSSECHIAPLYRPDDPHTFILRANDLIEFLDVTTGESHKNLLQAWELEVGKKYEVVLTTNDGLWRYRLGDVIDVVGFDASDGAPAFTLFGRRSLEIRVGPILISDAHIISATQAISPDIIKVNEFTTVLDTHQGKPTVGLLVELEGVLGPNAHFAALKFSEGLAASVADFQTFLKEDYICPPTVRIVRPGTFTAYRQWRVEKLNVGPGQMKLPAILLDKTSMEWVLGRVVEEL